MFMNFVFTIILLLDTRCQEPNKMDDTFAILTNMPLHHGKYNNVSTINHTSHIDNMQIKKKHTTIK